MSNTLSAPSTADHVALQQLYARYAHAIDTGDGEGWAGCYSPEGTYWSSTFGTRTGHDELAGFARQHYEEWQEKGIETQHWINQPHWTVEEWGIAGRTYVNLMGAVREARPVCMLQTVYVDRLVRLDDRGWCLERRESHAQTVLVLP